LTAAHPGAATALLGEVAYGILPLGFGRGNGTRRAARLAADFVERIGSRARTAIGIGSIADEPAALGRSRSEADRALRVLRTGAGDRRVASIEEVGVDAVLIELSDIIAARNDGLSGPIGRLIDYDTKHRSHLVETLRAWLDAFGDVIAASQAVCVHPNTFRYRLRRLAEIGGIDLDDPDARFAAMVQLRLMIRPVAGAAVDELTLRRRLG
jgi:DNA-binding PucR family transcriptional regulator